MYPKHKDVSSLPLLTVVKRKTVASGSLGQNVIFSLLGQKEHWLLMIDLMMIVEILET